MSSAQVDLLDALQADLLYLLWRRRRNSDGTFASAGELHAQLLKGDAHTPYNPKFKTRNVRAAFAKLEQRGFVESIILEPSGERPGPVPQGYRLPEDSKIITWRSTSRIVLDLFNYPVPPVLESTFIQEIIQLRLRLDDSREEMAVSDVKDQIEYCIRKGYVRRSQGEGAARLLTTPQVNAERRFLEKIAEQKKPADSAAPPEPSAGRNGGLVAGAPQS